MRQKLALETMGCMCDTTLIETLVSKQLGYISTSDLSCLVIVEKMLLFKNGFEIENDLLKAFHMLLTSRNCYHFSFHPGCHLMQVICVPEKEEIHLSSSFSVGPTEVKIEVFVLVNFLREMREFT